MAKKPKTPKIQDSPYKKPFINYQEKLLFKRNIIPYIHFIKYKMDPIKKNLIIELLNIKIIQ